jgi:hypothetical protein
MTQPTNQKTKVYKTTRSDSNNTTKKSYKEFVEQTGRSDISYKMFSSIPGLVHEKMINKIYSGRYCIRIPKMGLLKLLKVTSVGEYYKRIDWGRYKQTGVWAPHRNNHTDGFIYKVHLYFYERKYPELSFFRFKLARKQQRRLADLIFNQEIHR